MLCSGVLQAATPLAGAWRDVRDGDTPAKVMEDFRQGQMNRFAPDLLLRLPQGARGSWVVLDPQPPWVQEERVLSIYPPPLGTVTLYDHNRPTVSLAMDDFQAAIHGHGRLAFLLGRELPAAAPLLLKFEPSARIAAPVSFRLQGWAS